ncbi:DNA internalization-related competence protein ComEC/Rec2 [Anaerobium acetethylicum]|uniref:Competence protein ComEC n=1 Tax=Anaerobium acetethylicum TaxID=1619234 RepID=A0A1D3TT47_9FIRM|nr:DNA internalization-related competence protein ComEC/Rec2 [Anaerobium acetethylicum]SCP97118.1 competence protein ComEC [Anaerobium acetethylicum]
MRKRPLAAVFLAFITGIFLAGFPLRMGVAAILVSATAFMVPEIRKRLDSPFLLILPIMAIGGMAYTWQDAGWPDAIGAEAWASPGDGNMSAVGGAGECIEENRAVAVTGKVYKREIKNGKNLVYIKNTSIAAGSKGYRAGQIILYFDTDEHFLIGNTIKAEGTVKNWDSAGNEGQFDAASYYRAMKIDYKVDVSRAEVVDETYSSYRETLQKVRERLERSFEMTLGEQDASIMKTMILGDKSELDRSIEELYQKSGIVHILSISGQHISLIGMVLYNLLRRLGLSFKKAGCLCIFCVISYGIMTGLGISSFRAVLMFSIGVAAQMWGRSYDVITAMSLSAFLLLFENPRYLYNPGFLLSFGAVAGIMVVAPAIENAASKKNIVIRTLSASIGINVVTIPILAYYYYELPVYSILLNILIIPPMSIVLISGILCGIAGNVSIPVAVLFAAPCHYILLFCEKACSVFMSLPHALHVTGRPEKWQLWLYYCLLAVFIAGVKRKWGRKCLAILPLLILVIAFQRNEGFSATFLDVGQGDGIYIETPEGLHILVDGGSTGVKEVGTYRIIPFLKYNGTGVIDYAIVTHADEDHISGLKEILEESDENGIRVRCLLMPDTSLKDEAYLGLVSLAQANGVKVKYIRKGTEIRNGDFTIKCLHPTAEFPASSRNSYSTVLDVSCGGFDMLLTGDLEADGEKLILESGLMRDYDLLKVAHHGSKFSTSQEFIEAVTPEIAVISCGEGNRFGHPHQEVLDRIKSMEVEIMTTPDCGQITIRMDGSSMKVERFLKY